MNVLSLQTCGDCFVDGLKQSYVPLNAEICVQNVKKPFIVAFLINQDGKNAYIALILLYKSVKRLFCFKSRDRVSLVSPMAKWSFIRFKIVLISVIP